jgi:hypothetical protein
MVRPYGRKPTYHKDTPDLRFLNTSKYICEQTDLYAAKQPVSFCGKIVGS